MGEEIKTITTKLNHAMPELRTAKERADGWRRVDLEEPGYKWIVNMHGAKTACEEWIKEYKYDKIIYFEIPERDRCNKWGEELMWCGLYVRNN